jgi:hypothetical protein
MDNISLVLSGGSSNVDPSLSLGGDPSSVPIVNNHLNNLFDNVTQDESDVGSTEYRCFYVFNDTDYLLKDMNLWIFYEFPGGATVQLGITSQNEVHRITVQGAVTGGSFTLSYTVDGITYNIVANYNSNAAIWKNNLQNAFLAEDVFSGVTTVVYTSIERAIFDITFGDYNGKRSYALPTATNNLIPSSPSTGITTIRTYTGAPINTIAPQISASTTPPGTVTFSTPSEESPITIPTLKVEEGVPIWIKRIVPANASPKTNDGCTIRIQAEAVES